MFFTTFKNFKILKEKIFRNKKSHNQTAAATSNDADGSFCDVTPRHGSMTSLTSLDDASMMGRDVINEEQELSKKVLLMGANYNQRKMTSSPPSRSRGSTENLAGNSSRRASKKLSSQLKNLLKRKK